MSYPHLLRLASSAAFGGSIYAIIFPHKRNPMRVNADPGSPGITIFDPPREQTPPKQQTEPFTIYDETRPPLPLPRPDLFSPPDPLSNRSFDFDDPDEYLSPGSVPYGLLYLPVYQSTPSKTSEQDVLRRFGAEPPSPCLGDTSDDNPLYDIGKPGSSSEPQYELGNTPDSGTYGQSPPRSPDFSAGHLRIPQYEPGRPVRIGTIRRPRPELDSPEFSIARYRVGVEDPEGPHAGYRVFDPKSPNPAYPVFDIDFEATENFTRTQPEPDPEYQASPLQSRAMLYQAANQLSPNFITGELPSRYEKPDSPRDRDVARQLFFDIDDEDPQSLDQTLQSGNLEPPCADTGEETSLWSGTGDRTPPSADTGAETSFSSSTEYQTPPSVDTDEGTSPSSGTGDQTPPCVDSRKKTPPSSFSGIQVPEYADTDEETLLWLDTGNKASPGVDTDEETLLGLDTGNVSPPYVDTRTEPFFDPYPPFVCTETGPSFGPCPPCEDARTEPSYGPYPPFVSSRKVFGPYSTSVYRKKETPPLDDAGAKASADLSTSLTYDTGAKASADLSTSPTYDTEDSDEPDLDVTPTYDAEAIDSPDLDTTPTDVCVPDLDIVPTYDTGSEDLDTTPTNIWSPSSDVTTVQHSPRKPLMPWDTAAPPVHNFPAPVTPGFQITPEFDTRKSRTEVVNFGDTCKRPARPRGPLISRLKRKLHVPGSDPIEQYHEYPNWAPFEFGGPIFPHPEVPVRRIIEFEDFILCYDNMTKQPAWTLELITRNNINRRCSERFCPANAKDTNIDEIFSSDLDDYLTLGRKYREANVADPRLHPTDVKGSAVYSNVVPQRNPPPNRPKPRSESIFDEWFEYVKYLTALHDKIYVLSGPLYLPTRKNIKAQISYEVFGKHKVAIPTHYFKVILAKNPFDRYYRLECFKIANEYTDLLDLKQHHVTRAVLESQAGFLIFPNVADIDAKPIRTDIEFLVRRHAEHFEKRKWYDARECWKRPTAPPKAPKTPKGPIPSRAPRNPRASRPPLPPKDRRV